MSYATVVVGTDGSEPALAAVDRAAEVAARDRALLIVVAVHSGVPSRAPAWAAPQDSDAGFEQVLGTDGAEEALQRASTHAENAGAAGLTTVLAEGDPAQGLLTVARERGADLIVLGNRGINRLSGRLLGSVPADVAYRSPCDVLIVHASGDGGE